MTTSLYLSPRLLGSVIGSLCSFKMLLTGGLFKISLRCAARALLPPLLKHWGAQAPPHPPYMVSLLPW